MLYVAGFAITTPVHSCTACQPVSIQEILLGEKLLREVL